MSKEREKKGSNARKFTVALVGILDVAILPHLLNLLVFILEDGKSGIEKWKSYSYLQSYKDLGTHPQLLKLFVMMQFLYLAFVIYTLWNTEKLRRKRSKGDEEMPNIAGEGQHGTSRWQTEEEKDKNATVWDTVSPIKKGGIIYGMDKEKNKIWYNDDDEHTLIIGATRSGKSRKNILPSIWEIGKSGESMILGDPKGELYITSREYLKKQGYNVVALNLREPSKGNQWNILDLVNKAVDEGNIAKASELAWDIANAICNKKESSGDDPVWGNGQESTIAALILLVSMESDFKFQRHMASVYYLLAEYGQELEDGTVPLIEYIKTLPVQHPAKGAFATASIAPYKMRASFFTMALSTLRLFADQTIADMTSNQDHDLKKIGIEKTAVFLIVPDEKKTRHVLATLYIDQVYQCLVELSNNQGGRIPRRVNIIIDEFGNLPAIPNFDTKLTVGGGRGVRFTIAVQDIQQLKSLYKESHQTITGNCHTWIYIKTADTETAKLISAKTGKYTVATESVGASVQNKGHSVSVNEGVTGRAVVMEDEVLRWDSNYSLVLPVGKYPAKYPMPDLSQYKANAEFGFKSTGNIDEDKKSNQEIIKNRWDSIEERVIKQPEIWLPDLEDILKTNHDEKAIKQPANQGESNIKEEEENFL
jgi:type IV secretion system protein VirD4|nr:type IV secretory system conjugative DNA transfer family protein [Clostridium paraputrificum]